MINTRRLIGLFIIAVGLVALTACDSGELTGPDSSENLSGSSTAMTNGFEDQDLIAGQNTKVGTVELDSLSSTEVRVTYKITKSGWCITEWHLHVADTFDGIPTNRPGNPIPGRFEYSDTEDCVLEVVQDVDVTGFTYPIYVAAHAVVEGSSGSTSSGIFGITNDEGEIYQVDVPNETSTLLFDTGIDGGNANWPNGLAFDEATDRLYYVGNRDTHTLYFINVNSPGDGPTVAGNLDERNAGADVHNGSYYYIPHFGEDDLHRVDFATDGTIDDENIVANNFAGGTSFAFGDLAGKDSLLYVHAERFDGDGNPEQIEFFTINLNTFSYNQIQTSVFDEEDGYTGEYVAKLQLAFGNDGTLYGHQTFQSDRELNADGSFFTINLDTGDLTPINSGDATIDGLQFNDLASAPPPPPEFGEETAWAFGEPFPGQNWATYFTWSPDTND